MKKFTTVSKPWGNFPLFLRITKDCFYLTDPNKELGDVLGIQDYATFEMIKKKTVDYEIESVPGSNDWVTSKANVDSPGFHVTLCPVYNIRDLNIKLSHGSLFGHAKKSNQFILIYYRFYKESRETDIILSYISTQSLYKNPTKIYYIHVSKENLKYQHIKKYTSERGVGWESEKINTEEDLQVQEDISDLLEYHYHNPL